MHDKTSRMTCVPSEDSDQPGHLPSLIRVFAVRMKKAWDLSYRFSPQRRLWSDWADAQADLSSRWAHMPFCWFCHEVAQILFVSKKKSTVIVACIHILTITVFSMYINKNYIAHIRVEFYGTILTNILQYFAIIFIIFLLHIAYSRKTDKHIKDCLL